MEDEKSYFLRRAEQERAAADRADGKARKAHEELAERYAHLVQSEGAQGQASAEPGS